MTGHRQKVKQILLTYEGWTNLHADPLVGEWWGTSPETGKRTFCLYDSQCGGDYFKSLDVMARVEKKLKREYNAVWVSYWTELVEECGSIDTIDTAFQLGLQIGAGQRAYAAANTIKMCNLVRD